MSDESKKSKKKSDPARPFDATVLEQAKRIAGQHQIVVHHEKEEGYWYGYGLELPLTMGGGKTAQACIRDTQIALIVSVATTIERGETPSMPAKQGRRTQQVNVRLTDEEKAVLTATAKARGFKGLGDYLRSTALSRGA